MLGFVLVGLQHLSNGLLRVWFGKGVVLTGFFFGFLTAVGFFLGDLVSCT